VFEGRYRRATPADAAELAAFAARLFTTSYQHAAEPGELQAYVQRHFSPQLQHAELCNPDMTTFLAVAPGIHGYAQVLAGGLPECELSARSVMQLKRIYVDPHWQGRGVAQELLRLAEGDARARDCDVLWLAVWEINQRALSFYRKQGFEIIGRQGFPPGSAQQTDYVMAKVVATELH
jgi:ribosomal protein S18 acetylase RimI-like enzyme